MRVTSALDQGSQMEKEMRRMRQYGKAVGEGTLRCMLRAQNHICKNRNPDTVTRTLPTGNSGYYMYHKV